MMREYNCDNWVVIKMKGDYPHYRVLVGSAGGYLDSNSWRINSGITSVEEDEAAYYFFSASGSRYRCGKRYYMLRMNTASVWERLQKLHGDKVEMMPKDTDWMNMDWIISRSALMEGQDDASSKN